MSSSLGLGGELSLPKSGQMPYSGQQTCRWTTHYTSVLARDGSQRLFAFRGIAMIDVGAFLKHNFEGYLFSALGAMEQDDPNGKRVGYPLVIGACAGIDVCAAPRSASAFK